MQIVIPIEQSHHVAFIQSYNRKFWDSSFMFLYSQLGAVNVSQPQDIHSLRQDPIVAAGCVQGVSLSTAMQEFPEPHPSVYAVFSMSTDK